MTETTVSGRANIPARLYARIGRRQRELSDRVHAGGDQRARCQGWGITTSTGRFGFGARTYRDLRFDYPPGIEGGCEMAVPEAVNQVELSAIARLLASDMREEMLVLLREIFKRNAPVERLGYSPSPEEAANLGGISRELVHDLLRTGQFGSVPAIGFTGHLPSLLP